MQDLGSGREKLFDLAINRSLSFAKKMGKLRSAEAKPHVDELDGVPSKAVLSLTEADLKQWHQTTRFAYRVSLKAIVCCLNTLPDMQKDYFWQGGVEGSWFEGKTSQP